MSTDNEYLNYILEQLSDLDNITHRQMMGEYIIYYKGRIAAYLCDNRLLIKPTETAKKLIPSAPLEPPYEGAKDMLLAEETDDKNFLTKLFKSIFDELPEPKHKSKKKI